MSSIDFSTLRGERANTTGVPEDGLHTARLERAVLQDTAKGPRLITEWSDENNLMWTSWNRFTADQYGMPKTQELLDGLGVDRSKLTDENFGDELATVEGGTYQVRTTSQQGSQGDRWFTETTIEQPIAGRQQELSDIPADTTGLPEPKPPPKPAAGDDLFDDIPF